MNSNLHNMIKKQYIHKIEKYYIAIQKIHKRAFLNRIVIYICFLTYCHILNVFILILISMQDVNGEL
jgi:hypothetical protein